MMRWTKESIRDTFNRVGEKAAIDDKFRNLCLVNIHRAVRSVSDLEIPTNFKINVIDNSGYNMSLTLPPRRREDNELTETELVQVAGGNNNNVNDFIHAISDGLIFKGESSDTEIHIPAGGSFNHK
jgi:lysine/ornithine N-monooxygenase